MDEFEETPQRKRRTFEHVLEDLSENFLERKVLKRGHVLRRPKRDYGVDVTMFHYADNGEIETKDYSGWIYGAEKDKNWTKKIKGGKTYPFPNPLRQNYRHQCSLIEFLKIRCPEVGLSKTDINTRVFSNVFFGPNAEVKTPEKLPEGISGSVKFIKSKKMELFSSFEVEQMFNAIRDGKLPNGLLSGIATHRKHVASLNERHNRKAGEPCPHCGERLVVTKAWFSSASIRGFFLFRRKL